MSRNVGNLFCILTIFCGLDQSMLIMKSIQYRTGVPSSFFTLTTGSLLTSTQFYVPRIKIRAKIFWFLVGKNKFEPVFRIHDILAWIQIRIRGSMPLTNGSGFGCGSCYFRQRPLRHQQKTIFQKYVCLMIEGSGSAKGSGSGSGRPKNMWIRIRWIRIRNTGLSISNIVSDPGQPSQCGSKRIRIHSTAQRPQL